MPDPLVDLAKTGHATLAAATFSLPVDWRRAYRIVPLAIADLQGDVVGRIVVGETVDTLVGRHEGAEQLNLAIGLQRKIDPAHEIDDTDALVTLTGEVKDLLKNTPLASETYRYSFVQIARNPIFDPENLVDAHVFSSLIVATYRLGRAA